MAKSNPADAQLSPQELLEARVDAMMDPEIAASPPAKKTAKDAPSAPKLSEPVTVETVMPQLVRNRPAAAQLEAPVTPETATPIADDGIIAPLQIDTAQSDAAIDDIVAQEADTVLRAEDAGIAEAAAAADDLPPEPLRRGHPIFWFIILLLVIVIVIAAVVLTNPNLQLPFGA